MKKCKFFMSLLKERDWLEEMAAKGWLLTNMNLGMIYHFRQAEPCEKVFEIERFGVSSHPTVQELNARKFAIDVATQSDWEVVTHDEEMNYYFMKDKAGDETDEFYDDEVSRKERAERFRKRYSYEAPILFLKETLFFAIIDIALLILMVGLVPDISNTILIFLTLLFAAFMFVDSCMILLYLKWGQRMYDELCMSREEWERYKRFGVKKRFKKIHQLQTFLQEQSESGLTLVDYKSGHYLFEEDTQQYDYFIDTKACLKIRLKNQGIRFKNDEKDLSSLGLKWYEMSMADAAQYGLKPIGSIKKTALIYKRPHSDEVLPQTNGNKSISWQNPTLFGSLFFFTCIIVGWIMGFYVGMFFF